MPNALRLWARRAAFATVLRPLMATVDVVDGVRRSARGLPPLPPRRLLTEISGQKILHFWGDGNYESAGVHFRDIFVKECGLKAGEKVLEIGCGVGRIAHALIPVLGPSGFYAGVDVMADAVQWCQKYITPRHPNFQFSHCNVYNGQYNPRATLKSTEYHVPYPDGHFDFLFMTSVFTHLMPGECPHYFREIARALRPGGRALVTIFIIGEKNRAAVEARTTGLAFPYVYDGYRVFDAKVPEAAIAFEEKLVHEWLAGAGLKVRALHPGDWRGLGRGLTGQDAIILEK